MSDGARYDAWLFDLDGTLVGIRDAYVHEVIDRVGDRLGRGFTPAQADAVWHGLGGGANERLAAWGVDPEAFWTAFHEEEDPASRADAAYLYDDAAWVGDLDVPAGLVTHCQSYLTEAVLDRLDIGDWFDTVVCCDETTGWKPDPRPVELALADLGVGADPRDGTHGRPETGPAPVPLVGDSPCDVGAAWNAGLEGVHVERHGHERRGCCVLGDRRLDSLAPLGPAPSGAVPSGSD
jgi:phosphoglycolate phosphatase